MGEKSEGLGLGGLPDEPREALLHLNDSQREAVTTTEGYVRVIAGAGSGKTRALSRRFAYLVNELGIMPGNILCVTFTNKAANEMRQRIHHLTGDDDAAYVNTFHGFCVSVLQEDSSALGYPKSFLVLDNSDIDQMLAIIYEERGITLRDMTYARARDMFEMRKCVSERDYYKLLVDLSLEKLKAKYDEATAVEDILFYGYLYQEKKCFGLDYNDLIFLTLHVFATREDIRLKWQGRLEYIMIDEFQDIDPPQYELMEVLQGLHHNLFVVGDPDQTIYTWRGANVRFLLDFDKRFSPCTTIYLRENYRSTPQVLSVANSLIEKNSMRLEKDLVATLPDGGPVRGHHAKSSADEARWIADTIEDLHAGSLEEGRNPVDYRDIAILYRAHYVTRSIEEVLIRREIPYTIYSGVQFFDRAEVKDALSYLRMVCYQDDLSFMRVANRPKRNIGEQRMRFLRNFADGQHISLFEALRRSLDDPLFKGTGARDFVRLIEAHLPGVASRPVSELLASLLDKSGYELALRTEGSQERLDNLAELRQSIYEYETSCGEEATLERYLTHVALFSGIDQGLGRDKVKLMTVHAAKGLEFDHVIMASLNEGVFPSRKVRTRESMEEERRLCFVAMTRACKGLYLVDAEGATLEGIPRYPSRFVLDVEPSLISFDEPLPQSLVAEARDYIALKDRKMARAEAELAAPRFEAGARVRHRVFGLGSVLSVDEEKRAYQVQFDDLGTIRTITFRVPMEAAER